MLEISMSSPSPLFPANRAFVVQFQEPAEDTTLLEHGRVEHLVSGQATRFASLDELLRFISRILTEIQESPKL
jgi:hypothetical protein